MGGGGGGDVAAFAVVFALANRCCSHFSTFVVASHNSDKDGESVWTSSSTPPSSEKHAQALKVSVERGGIFECTLQKRERRMREGKSLSNSQNKTGWSLPLESMCSQTSLFPLFTPASDHRLMNRRSFTSTTLLQSKA